MMMKTTLAIIGGSQEVTLKKIGIKLGCNILFHGGKTRNGGNKKEFKNIIKKADCVVIQIGALGHISMDMVKEICKDLGKELVFHNGFGASGAISMGLERLAQINQAA
jgi:hypothetical protein